MTKRINGEIMGEAVLRITAMIMGSHSGAAQALADMKKRKQEGQDAVCIRIGNVLRVYDRKDFEKE